MTTLKLIGIGGLGTMLSPSAKHLKNNSTAKYLRILDRGSVDDIKKLRRQDWQDHGTQLVSNMKDLIGDGDFDGIIICAGKNGDDHEIFSQLIPLLKSLLLKSKKSAQPYFILHLSTISCDFVKATYDYCHQHNIDYANYPLTGGAKGAQTAKMLILCSGDEKLYEKTKSMLEQIGVPKYFNSDISYAAAVKLVGHIMVFHGLLGISLASVLHNHMSDFEKLNADQKNQNQIDFFDFLNGGAGGTKQWDVALRHSLSTHDWQTGFSIKYAVIDIFYTIKLLLEKQIPRLLILPLLEISLLFIYILKNNAEKNLATQTIAKLISETPDEIINQFLKDNLSLDINHCLKICIDLLPKDLQKILMLEVSYD